MGRAFRAVIAAIIAIAGLSACNTGIAGRGSGCAAAQAKDQTGRYPAYLVLLDLSDNSARTAERIDEAIKPFLTTALKDGAFVRLAALGGTGQTLRVSGCMDGTHAFHIQRHNTGRRDKDTRLARAAFDGDVRDVVRGTTIAATGTVTRLIGSAPEQIGELESASGGRVRGTTVVIWSDLLGDGDHDDCLDVDGQPATPGRAAALVRRCFVAGQLRPLDAAVRLLGVGYDARNEEQSLMATLLAARLCTELGRTCEGAGVQ